MDSEYVARYAIKRMFKNKKIIVPGFGMKLAKTFSKLVPDSLLAKISYNSQKRK